MRARKSDTFLFKKDTPFALTDFSIFAPKGKTPPKTGGSAVATAASGSAAATPETGGSAAPTAASGSSAATTSRDTDAKPAARAQSNLMAMWKSRTEAGGPPSGESAVCDCGPGGGPKAASASHTQYCAAVSPPPGQPPPPADQADSPEAQPPPPGSPGPPVVSVPPDSPVRSRRRSAGDLSGDSPGPPPSPGLVGIIKVHNCFIKPDYLTDRVLLDASGCYNGDLVDVFFHETARTYDTQTAKLSLAYSLSVLGGKGEHVHKPEDLVKFGSHLDFATPPGIMPFPISITTHAGGPDERASNDYHYSAAVYSVSRNQIFHADSLSYPAHTYLATIQLAEWIVHCAEKRGTAIDKPEYIGVPCTQQGRTMYCGPTSVLNNRLIITHLQGPPVRTRFKIS